MASNASSELKVWVVEDNDLLRTSTASLLEEQDGLSCPLATPTCEETLEALSESAAPDIVLMDIGLPGMDGVEGTRRLRELSPDTRVLVLTVHDEREIVFDAIMAGASGYLLKSASPEEVVEAIRKVGEGGAPVNAFIARKLLDAFADRRRPAADYGLTDREREVLECMVEGLSMQSTAERLLISYHTVDAHIRNIYDKLHVRTCSRAVAKALKENLLS